MSVGSTTSGDRVTCSTSPLPLVTTFTIPPPAVVSKRRLADSLGRWDREITDNAVEIYVSRLRSKLQHTGVAIRTVRGIGYRLDT